MTMLAFTSAYSQCLAMFPSKHVMLFAVTAFEFGSGVCGAAPNMIALILGRAIAGFGGSGIIASCIIILSEMTTLKQRAIYMGFIGISLTIAPALGPFAGGVLSDDISWRWCFYINLPIGGFAFALLFALVETRHPYGMAQTYQGYGMHMLRQLVRCDLMGVAIALLWGVVSVLGLQWGGVTKSWNHWSVVVCFLMSDALAVIFVAWEAFMGNNAMLPLKLFQSRTVRGAGILSMFGWASFIIAVYYFSLGFQAVYKWVLFLRPKIHAEFRFRSMSALEAGIHLLPLIMVEMLAVTLAGRLIFHVNLYFVILLGPVFITAGYGLLYFITPNHPIARLMGGEVLVGIGVGMFLQNIIIVTQWEFRHQPHLVTPATGSIILMGNIGRLIGVSTAGSVFENMLQVNIHKYAPDVPQSLIMAAMNAADALWRIVPPPYQAVVLQAYVKTLEDVFLVGIFMGGLGFVVALLMPKSRMNLRDERRPQTQDVEKRSGERIIVGSSEAAVQTMEAGA